MSRSWRIVFSTICVLLLAINLAMFITEFSGYGANDWVFYWHNIRPLKNGDYKFRGIGYFAQYIETFPALANCQVLVSRVSKFLNGDFHTNNGNFLDVLYGIYLILSCPVELIIAFLVDIFNNFRWIIGFLFPNWFGA